jgi:hypothetical protein
MLAFSLHWPCLKKLSCRKNIESYKRCAKDFSFIKINSNRWYSKSFAAINLFAESPTLLISQEVMKSFCLLLKLFPIIVPLREGGFQASHLNLYPKEEEGPLISCLSTFS